MPESLSDRLKSLGLQVGAQNIKPAPRKAPTGHPIHEVLEGRFAHTPFGEAFLVEQRYPQDFLHGTINFSDPCDMDLLCQWGHTPRLADKQRSDIIFLDTETSGLAGGTGTYAFLVGLGYWTDSGYTLAQLFMEEPVKEPALISALGEILHPFSAIVTFNGKSFDIPLLRSRHILNGITPPFEEFEHLDLLHLSRRIWRNRLANRALSNLETEILGVSRNEQEINGWEIPQMYFDYLRSRDARPLARVFYHNAIDILSLSALFSHTARLLSNPLQSNQPESLDLIAIAQLHEDLGNREEAIRLYEEALRLGLPRDYLLQTLLRYAILYRKQNDWQRAVELWTQASGHRCYEACLELAKYYEHQARDYPSALHWTQQAGEQLLFSGQGAWSMRSVKAELAHRQERIERKIRSGYSAADTEEGK